MDAREFVRLQIAAARRVNDGVTTDLTDDLLNWTPPGTANRISATYAHIVGGEDNFIQVILQGKPRLWETEGWREKLGVKFTPRRGADWDEYRTSQISLSTLRAYQERVKAATGSYLETLTETELGRKVLFYNEERTVGDMLALLVTHITQHSGEIAVLKGIQGAKGLAT